MMNKKSLAIGFTFVTALSGLAFAHGGRGGMMRHLDQNNDGKVTLDEALAGAKARFAKIDANKDGAISKDEAKGPMSHRFAKKDANNDGKITLAEVETAARARFAAADKNKDNVLAGDELAHKGRGGPCGDKHGKGGKDRT
jgi:hypothetical protein